MLWPHFILFLAFLTNVVQIGSIYNKTIETNNLKITVMKLDETDDMSNSDPSASNSNYSGRRSYDGRRLETTLDPMANEHEPPLSRGTTDYRLNEGGITKKMTSTRQPAEKPPPETDTSPPPLTTTMANSLEGKGWLDPGQFSCCISYSDTSEPTKTCSLDPSVSNHVMLLYKVGNSELFTLHIAIDCN